MKLTLKSGEVLKCDYCNKFVTTPFAVHVVEKKTKYGPLVKTCCDVCLEKNYEKGA